MEPAGAWVASIVGCLVLGLIFDLVFSGILEAVFGSGWGKRGRRLSATLAQRYPDAVSFLIGPIGGPRVSGTWLAVVVDDGGLTAFRANGRVAWVVPWERVRSVWRRDVTLVIERSDDPPLTICPQRDGGGDQSDAALDNLVTQIRARRTSPAAAN